MIYVRMLHLSISTRYKVTSFVGQVLLQMTIRQKQHVLVQK